MDEDRIAGRVAAFGAIMILASLIFVARWAYDGSINSLLGGGATLLFGLVLLVGGLVCRRRRRPSGTE